MDRLRSRGSSSLLTLVRGAYSLRLAGGDQRGCRGDGRGEEEEGREDEACRIMVVLEEEEAEI